MSIKRETRFEHEFLEDYEDGECIFEEGDTGRDLYIVQSGSVQILKKTKTSAMIEMATFKKGDFFGDMALLQSLPRYASAYAKGKTKLLILKPAGFLLKIRRDPTFAFEMLQQLSYRVKMSNDRLLHVVEKNAMPVSEIQEILKILGGAGGDVP
jgi:CRP/FNR family cyclic AMP-dependent transcriptional regulator